MNYCIENKSILARRMRYLMNTFCEISAEGEDSVYVAQAIEEAFLELKRIERTFSRYISESEVSRINQNAAKSAVKVDNEVFQLMVRSLELSRLTSGAFDITVGGAVDFWRGQEEGNILPAETRIKELKAKIGYQNIALYFDKQSIYFTKPGMQIDFGALAKGYAIDKIVCLLKAKGIRRFKINLGGNIYLLDSEPQTIAVRHPVYCDETIATVSLMDSSISTSANYERFFTISGRKFGHLLNPLTEYPAESDILSASVVSQDAALADALSTAIFVLGFKKGRELLEATRNASGVIIYKGIMNKARVYENFKGDN